MLNENDQKRLLSALDELYTYQQSSRNKSLLTFKYQGKGLYANIQEVTNNLVHTFRVCERPFTEEEVKEWLEDFQKKYISNLSPKNSKPKLVIADIGETASWIYEQLHDASCPVHLSDRGDMIEFVSDGVRISGNEKIVRSWLTTRVRDLGLTKVYRECDLDAGWTLLKQKFQTATKASKINMIKYTGSTFVDDFLKYIYDYLNIAEEYAIFEMIFKHWMWCLKRRIFNKSVIWHIWPNFKGAQGIGKTQMLNRMFAFIEDFTVTTNLKILNDAEREYRKFTDNYILIFDDLNSGENNDSDLLLNDSAVDTIKQMTTQEILTIREFQTQNQIRVKNTFMPISTANKHLYDIIYDGDVMRRWFEFNCQRNTPPASYDELNAILERFPEALQGIDENNDKGYWIRGTETCNKIVEIQKHYIPTNTSTNTWIDYCHVTPDLERSEKTKFMAPEYKQYMTYCRAVGKHAAGLQRVTMILARLWPECIDDAGIAHVFIESKVDESTGVLICNDITKLEPIPLTDSKHKSIFDDGGIQFD